MKWHDSLQRVTIGGKLYVGCSFRGVAFFIESSDYSGGRLGETHVFPFKEREPAYREDLGLAEQSFPVQGYLLGANVEVEKRALRDALNAAGPGELVHAYWGKMTASVISFTLSEKAAEGRFVRISVEFVQSSESPAFPIPTIDPSAALGVANSALLAALKIAHAAKYDPTAVASDFLTDLEAVVRDTARAINRPGSSLINGPQTLATYRQRLNYMAKNAASIVGSRLDSYAATERALDFAFAPPRAPTAILRLLDFIANFTAAPAAPPGEQTRSRAIQYELYTQLARSTRRQILAKCVEVANAATFDIFEDAKTVRDALIAQIEAELDSEGDDAVWHALEDLRVGVLLAIPIPSEQAQEVTTFVPTNTTSSIVVAHRLYGDLDRELEIVARNNIPHPGFVAGGVPLEVVVSV